MRSVCFFLATAITCAYSAQEASDVVAERLTAVPTWSVNLVEIERCRPESDVCDIALHAEDKNKTRRQLLSSLMGPFILLLKTKKILSCEDNAIMSTQGPVLIGLDGSKTLLPTHPGYLRDCRTVGTGEELLLIYSLIDQEPYNLVRIIDSSGKLIVERRLDSAGLIEFIVSGKCYQAHIPAPEHPW